jgi:hypothetical protein
MTRRWTRLLRLVCLLAVIVSVTQGIAQAQAKVVPKPPDNDGWRTEIYPVYGWVPSFSSNLSLPDQPGSPGSGPSVMTSSNFNGAVASAVRIERRRWFVQGEFLWAGLSGSVASPHFELGLDITLSGVRSGVRIAPALYIEGGIRHIGMNLDATLTTFPTVYWKPAVWDGLVGTTYRPQFGKRTRLIAHGDIGGIGDSDYRSGAASALLEWKAFSHFALGGGYGYLYLRQDGTLFGKAAHLDVTLHGPMVTIGIPF